jgi:hypothetical protein
MEVVMAKKLKTKLPKRIAGVKIPKGIRKGPIGSFLSSSGGQLVIAEVLLAAGGFYAARRIDPNTPAGQALRHPIDSMRAKLGGHGGGTSDRFARALRVGLDAFRNTWHEPFPDGAAASEQVYDTSAATEGLSSDLDPFAKKPSSSRGETSRREAGSGTH